MIINVYMKLYTILRNQRTHPFSCFAVRSANSTGGSERRSGQNSLYKFPLVPTVNRHSAGTPAKSQISGHVLAFAPQRYHVVPLVSSDAPTSTIIMAALYHRPKYWQTLEIRVSSGTKNHLSWFLQALHHLLVNDTDVLDHVGLSCQCSPPYPS
jgi:hypothetical protein